MGTWHPYHRSSGASGHERVADNVKAEVTYSRPGEYAWLVIERPITNGSFYKRGYAKTLAAAKTAANRALRNATGKRHRRR